MALSRPQLWKALPSTVVIVEGMVTSVKLAQLAKAELFILVTLAGNVIEVRAEPLKAELPMVVIDDGIAIPVKELHSRKTSLGIVVNWQPSSKVIEDSAPHERNTFVPPDFDSL